MFQRRLPSTATLQSSIVLLAALFLLQPNFVEASSFAVSANRTIYFLAIGPYPKIVSGFNPSWSGGPAVIAAARLARDHINNRSDILPGYQLELLEGDSGCQVRSTALISFAKYFIESGNRVAGIVGPGCSDVAQILAPLVARQSVSVIQIAPSATSPALVNSAYNTTFRILSSSLRYAETFMKVILYNSWRRVVALYDGERENFQRAFRAFKSEIDRSPEDISVVFESAIYKTFYPIHEIPHHQARIIFVFASTDGARNLMCLAYRMKLIYPTYQWIFHDRSLGGFLVAVTVKNNGITYNCSKNDMHKATNGIILNNYVLTAVHKDNKTLPVNVSYNDYYDQYKGYYTDILKELNITESDVDEGDRKWATTYYDATWALALALNKSIPELEDKGLTPADYSMGQKDITDIIVDKLDNKVDFDGVTGRVKFESTRDSPTVINITKVVCTTNKCQQSEQEFVELFDGHSLDIERGVFINDSFETTTVKVHVAVGSIVLFLTCIILVVTILLQLANVVYHNFKPIKATSPNLSHLIFSGCYLYLLAVVFFVSKDTFDVNAVVYGIFCNLVTMCVSLGFSLVFGTVCAKIWRVYRIFRHFRSERAGGAISDNALILFVILLLFLDMLLCTLWIMFDPWLRHSTDEFVETSIQIRSSCSCQHLLEWISALIAYKGTVTLVVLFLAVLNRRIQRKEFKHTKNISMFVYTVVLLAGVTLPLFQILVNIEFTVSFTVMSIFLLTTVCCCIVFIFLPPVIPLIKLKLQGRPINSLLTRHSTVTLLMT